MAYFEVIFFSLIKTHLAPKPIKQQEIIFSAESCVCSLGFWLEMNQPSPGLLSPHPAP